MGNAEPFQLFYTGSRVLPVFPDDGPNPASYPIIDGPEAGGRLGSPEVIPPAPGVGVEPGDNLLDAQPTAPFPRLSCRGCRRQSRRRTGRRADRVSPALCQARPIPYWTIEAKADRPGVGGCPFGRAPFGPSPG